MVYVIPLDRYLAHCRWPGCRAEPVEKQIPLCDRHFQYIGERFVDERTAFGSAYIQSLRPSLEARKEEHRLREERRAQALEAQSVVYYIRIGDHVKIGFTSNLRERLKALRVYTDNLLATEPGGRAVEAQRHQEFAAERVGRRENFNPSRRLLAHIEQVRNEHGAPVVTSYPRVG